MLDLLKLDLHRMFKNKLFYILAACVVMMVMTCVILANQDGATIASLIGSISSNNTDMMSAMMGVSVVPAIASVGFCLYVGKDFNTGFAKNIFTVHVSKWDYLLSKVFFGIIMISILVILNTVLTCVVGLAMGIPFGPVTVGRLVLYLIKKILLAIGLVSLTLFIQLLLKHTAWGVLFGILIGMGGLTMGLDILADMLKMPWIHTVVSYTISGSASLVNMSSNSADLIHCFVVTIVWSMGSLFLANSVLKKKNF